MLRSREQGFTTVDCDFSVFMTDIDDHDILEEFMKEVVSIREDRELWYRPVRFLFATGMLGMVHSEQVIVYVYNGIPYILGSVPSIDGTDERDGRLSTDGEQFLGRLFYKDNHTVYSLGVVPEGTEILRYATDYVNGNALIADPTIDYRIACSAIEGGIYDKFGTIYTPGGHRYDIYAVTPETSRAIRPSKDYRLNPEMESGVRPGYTEVILIGGFPEIVPIGEIASVNGDMFSVWVPNDVNDYRLADFIFQSDWLPHDIFDVDIDDMADAYALFCVRANEMDVTNRIEDMPDDDEEPDAETEENS